jgi:hypothetical protein
VTTLQADTEHARQWGGRNLTNARTGNKKGQALADLPSCFAVNQPGKTPH